MKVEYEENISKLRAEIQYRIEECNKFGEEISNLRNKEHSYLQKIKELEGLASRRVEDPSLRSKVAELEHLVATYTRQINEYKIETTNLQTEISQL
jgi:predicted  nucleic acid-binding Zn-ribbon protein